MVYTLNPTEIALEQNCQPESGKEGVKVSGGQRQQQNGLSFPKSEIPHADYRNHSVVYSVEDVSSGLSFQAA